MLVYEVRYKCYVKGDYYSLPFISYRYRRSGMVFWEKKKHTYIDQFAYEYWGNKYYGEKLNKMSSYSRACTMQNIINKEYNGELSNYVRAMVEFEIMSDLIDKVEDYDTYVINMSFVTDGWERTTVKVKGTTEKAGA